MEQSVKTIQVQRANVVLSVPEYDKANYLAKGYDVLDEVGNVVEESMPNDVPTLQAKVNELIAENKRLKEQLANKSTPAKKETVKTAENKATEASGASKKSTRKTK